jgi:hypothetical protein
VTAGFDAQVRHAAGDLLADDVSVARVDALPLWQAAIARALVERLT